MLLKKKLNCIFCNYVEELSFQQDTKFEPMNYPVYPVNHMYSIPGPSGLMSKYYNHSFTV